MLEIIVAALTKGDMVKRKRVTWLIGTLIFIAGVPKSALSFGVLDDIKFFNKTIL